ncbi:hypothetical protein BDF20DRAFT_895315 [Mycotypha africana]|uniref:uncharacterized protein n=1 Tax=Mycotypha africana TaxID=64632 RepID=UPI0023009176|nr:uncharacterized protein BDF20DRAFT_895315 [Mycotypha africana]KAI8968269.1 hypothetical protein BDF20DRAFT_895315 [Mycotypha africana]
MTEKKDFLSEAGKAAAISGGVGFAVSAMQNTVQKHTTGAKGVFTRTGGTIAFFAAMGGIYTLGEAVSENMRGKHDGVNAAIGGCAAGLLAGIPTRSFAKMLAGCAAIGTTMYAFEASGQFSGIHKDKTSEEKRQYEKEFFKQPVVANDSA